MCTSLCAQQDLLEQKTNCSICFKLYRKNLELSQFSALKIYHQPEKPRLWRSFSWSPAERISLFLSLCGFVCPTSMLAGCCLCMCGIVSVSASAVRAFVPFPSGKEKGNLKFASCWEEERETVVSLRTTCKSPWPLRRSHHQQRRRRRVLRVSDFG